MNEAKQTDRHATYTLSAPNGYMDAVKFMASRSGPWTLLFVMLSLASLKAALDDWSALDLAVILSFLVFRSFFEWAVHSYLHHARPLPILGIRLKTSIHRMHVEHHKNPADLDAFLFKGRSVAGVAVVFFMMFWLLSGSQSLAISATIGFMLILMIHEVVHVICHSPIEPESPIIARLVRTHRSHHHVYAGAWLGVSSPWADRVLSTHRHPND